MQLNDLPQEILERIFSFTSQYTDYLSISQVCIKWGQIIEGLRTINKITFLDCLENGQIYWKSFANKFSPAQRHSHSSCRVDKMLFVFGGLSGTSTSYNDLWLFDLGVKAWSRPICNGSFPSPKAAATLVAHEKKILLYGGYSHPYSYLHQQVSFFDEMHIFCTVTSQWQQVLFSQEAPKLAGHTASLLNENRMVLFGGCNGSLGNKTNAVYCMDLVTFEWDLYPSGDKLENKILREIDGPKPECRYGHSQITLDDERILIIGGCGGPNKQYDDLWILHWPKDRKKHAFWQQVIVNNVINSPAQIYCISFVRYNNKLVTFGKPRIPVSGLMAKNEKNKLTIQNPFIVQNEDHDSNAYTLAGSTKEPQIRKCSCLSLTVPVIDPRNLNHILTPNAAASQPNNNISLTSQPTTSQAASINNLELLEDPKNLAMLNKSQRNTIKRLEALEKVASMFKQSEKIKQQLNTATSLTKTRNQCLVHSKAMQMFVLNINDLIDNSIPPIVSWQTPIVEFPGAPMDTILYTLNSGIDEIILFGGMEMESSNIQKSYENVKHRVSSRLYIMKPDSLFIPSG